MVSILKLSSIVCLSIVIASCGGGGGSGSSDTGVNESNIVYPYKGTSSPANLVSCLVGSLQNRTSCLLSDLPLIGMKYPDKSTVPTVDDIMNRVAVTHDWMGERFEELLKGWPPEMRLMFRNTTGIVIARNVRPSFYTPRTAAIYLDPAFLWLTNAEKATIDKKEDFRSGFSNGLSFYAYGNFVNGPGQGLAYRSFPLDGNEERALVDINLRTAALLFHELAHANDFYSVRRLGTLNQNQTVLSQTDPEISDRLSVVSPLENPVMKGLGRVMFLGDEASDEQKNLSPTAVGAEFNKEGAVDDYAYANPREDLAMLVEVTLMKYFFGVDRAFAVIDRPTVSQPTSDDFIVRYGNYNRLADDSVKQRAQLVLQDILPEVNLDAFFTGLDSRTDMVLGRSLADNIWGLTNASSVEEEDQSLQLNRFEVVSPEMMSSEIREQ